MAAKKKAPAKAPAKKAAPIKRAATPRTISHKTPDPLPVDEVSGDGHMTRIGDRNGLPCYELRDNGGFVFQSVALVVREGEDGEHYDHVAKWAYATGTSPYMNASEPDYPTRAAALAALRTVKPG